MEKSLVSSRWLNIFLLFWFRCHQLCIICVIYIMDNLEIDYKKAAQQLRSGEALFGILAVKSAMKIWRLHKNIVFLH